MRSNYPITARSATIILVTGITRIFKVQPGEGRMSLLLIGLMLAASAGMGLGGSGIDALFFARFGVQYLPTMYMLLGVVTLITMLVTCVAPKSTPMA